MIGFYHEYEEYGCFSNWYAAEFDYAGNHYMNSEQFMMFQKAWQFHRYDIAQKILETSDPQKAKKLARDIQVSSDVWERWNKTCRAIVKKGIKAKFAQNQDLLDGLLGTGTELLAECSPIDNRWGIGLAIDDPNRFDVSKWKGSNYLGVILMEVREELRQELSESNSKKLMYIDYRDAEPIPEWQKTAGELKRIPQYYNVIHAYSDTLPNAHQKEVFYNDYALYDWEIAMNTNMGGGLPIAGFFEMKQEVYEIARRMKHKTYITEIFEKKPPHWGLRGMPYFWDYLKTAFAFVEPPVTKKELAEKVKYEFEKKTHEPLTLYSRSYVEEFAHGGMSSGYINGDIIINEWLPELANRLEWMHFRDNTAKRPEMTVKLIAVSDDRYMFVKLGEAPPYSEQKCVVYNSTTDEVSPPIAVGSWTARIFDWRDPTEDELKKDWPRELFEVNI